MRRSTLSTLSPAQANSRHGGNDQGPVKRQAAGQGARPSLGMSRPQGFGNRLSDANVRNPAGRASTSYGMVKGQQSKTDNRPISSKQFQQTCIRDLLTYLGEHGYSHPLSHKLLTAPTGKDFFNIVQFLFKKVDPNLKITGKVEDEVPLLFKQLGYPFPISKSALTAVGTPHTWPGLLAALTWLVECLWYEERDAECREESSFDENVVEKEFDEYIGNLYQFYLEGDDVKCNLLDEEQEQRFAQIEQELPNTIETFMNDNAELQERVLAIQSQPSPKEAMMKKVSDIVADMENLDALIRESQTKQHDLELLVGEHKQAFSAIQAELSETQATERALKEKVAVQQSNQAASERLNEERRRLKDSVNLVTSKREAIEKAAWNCEVQVSKKMEELEEAVKLYRASGERLTLIPASAKRAGGVIFDINLNTRGDTPEGMLGSNLKAVVKPALQQLVADFDRQNGELQQGLFTLQEQLKGSQALIAAKQNAVHMLEVQLKEVELGYATEKEKTEKERAAYQVELEGITHDAVKRLNSSLQTLRKYDERCQATAEDNRKAETECSREAELLEGQLLASMEMLRKHKIHVERTLSGLNSTISHALNDLGLCKR